MKLEKTVKDIINIDKIDNVTKNPVYSTLMEMLKLIPFLGGLTDEIIKNKISEFKEEKRKKLIECINSDKQLVCSKNVNNVEFIINFAKTVEAVDRLSSNDKIKYFACLIKKTYLMNEKTDNSYYDEFLDVLTGLSYREINLLHEVYEYEKSLTEVGKFSWNNLYNIIIKKIDCDILEVKSIFMRLQSKGLMYAENEIGYILLEQSPSEKKGTTEYSKKFISKIIELPIE